MFSLETGTLGHKGRCAGLTGLTGLTRLEEAGAKIVRVGKDVSMKVQANNVGTADQRRGKKLRGGVPKVEGGGEGGGRRADGAGGGAARPAAGGRERGAVG